MTLDVLTGLEMKKHHCVQMNVTATALLLFSEMATEPIKKVLKALFPW